MNRCVIFAHFDRNDKVADYVLFYLNELKKNSKHITFVSTSQLSEQEQGKLAGITDQIFVRENTGYDFMSWKVGIESTKDIHKFDEVVICNDSVFGPLKPLDTIFSEMTKKKYDFWGLTNSLDFHEHVQSYFIAFSKDVVDSKVFNDFWKNMTILSSKAEIVQSYEVGLSKLLKENGFRFGVVTNYQRSWALKHLLPVTMRKLFKNGKATAGKEEVESISRTEPKNLFRLATKFFNLTLNPTQYAWDKVIDHGTPFLKVELLRENPTQVSTKGWQEKIRNSYLPIQLIEEHIRDNEKHL